MQRSREGMVYIVEPHLFLAHCNLPFLGDKISPQIIKNMLQKKKYIIPKPVAKLAASSLSAEVFAGAHAIKWLLHGLFHARRISPLEVLVCTSRHSCCIISGTSHSFDILAANGGSCRDL